MFFINHFAYLSVGQFDYQYNMKANISTGRQYHFDVEFSAYFMNIVCVCVWHSRDSNWNWMGHLVYLPAEKASIFLENFAFPIFSSNIIAVGGEGFSATVLGIGCARFMAFIDGIANSASI